MAIQVGSVEVDVIPNTQGIYQRLRAGLEPAATRAGADAGRAAGRSFGSSMQAQVGDIGLRIGEEIGQQIANRITASLRDAIRNGVVQGGRNARPSAVRQGDETAGAFSRALKTHLQAAFRSLPKLEIDANTSEADAEIQELRARMERLSNKRIGIDIDAGAAKAQIRLIEADLRRLGAAHPNVQVRADTASALAQLAAVRAAIAAVDEKKRFRFDVDNGAALAAIFQLTVALGAVAAIPALPVLAAGLGSITAAATAAGVGVGALAAVAVPAVKDIAGALQAQKAAQDAATQASLKGGQANSQGASKALQMAGAQQSLATAHRNAARQIQQAEQAVGDAVRSAADANRQAAAQVKQAKQSLADAVQQAADRQRDAAENVTRAEESLADAQRTARQAQQDLTQARKDAAVQLAELSDRLTNAQLSERDAVLDVEEARARLRGVQAKGAAASVIEQQRAQLAVEQAVQRLKEQKAETKSLSAEKARADKAGIAGSDVVKSAQERLAAAERGVADQQKALGKARTDAARQQVQGQRAIAAAQEKVAESQRNVVKVQEDGARSVARAQDSLAAAQQSAADSIASAQRQVASASRSAAGGIDQAAVAQAKYQQALAKMTPAARGTFFAFTSLRKAFGEWSRSLQPAVMPIFTRALNGLKNSLPGLTPFVLAAARAIGRLQDKVSAGFKSPWWKSFKKDLAGSVEPALFGLGVSFGRIFRGMAGIIQAFLPHMDDISRTMQRITGRFADWGTSLKGSDKFEDFLDYSARMGPVMAEALGDVAGAFFDIAKALSPLSGPVLDVIGAMARGIASIAENLPWLIQGMYLWYLATRVMTLAMLAFNLAMNANPITLIIIGIVALVAAVVYCYKRFEWFRNGVQAVWSWLVGTYNTYIKPFVDAIVRGFAWLYDVLVGHSIIPDLVNAIIRWLRFLLKIWRVIWNGIKALIAMLGRIAMWLWRNAIAPAFRGIATLARWLYRNVVRPMMNGIVGSFRLVAKIGRWLYNNALKPAFNGIATVARWLYRNVIRPVFGWISDRASWLYSKGLKPAFDRIKRAVKLVGDAFEKAKDAIGRAFGKIKSITAKPVNFVIKWVYTKGIKAVWDKVAGFVGLSKLPAAPKLLARGGTVGDEYGPARPMQVNRPTAIVGEGNPRYPEFVIPTDPKYRGRAQALHAAAGTRLMADGGILGDIGSGIKAGAKWTAGKVGAAVDKGVDWAKAGADLLTNPSKIWTRLVKPVVDRIKNGIGGSAMGKVVRKVPMKMISGLKDKVVNAVANMFDGGGGGQWAKPVAAAYGTRFGVRGRMWSSGRHTGLDFPAPTGKAVKAVDTGAITSASSGGPYGKHISINHGGGLSSLYAHLSRMIRTAGAVKRGQRIGSVGATGNVTGPHLHLEARKGGRAVDPMPYLSGGGGGKAGKGVQRWAGVVRQALSQVGQPASLTQTTLRRMNQESGGNPKAVNRWDSNWKAGHPSVGLMQVIRGTFRAYAGKYRNTGPKMYGVSTDPMANIYASMRYALSRYGSLSRAYNRPGGYDSGGWLQPGQLGYNGLSQPEAVLTPSQWNALSSAATRPAGGVGDLHVSVFVGDREITDIARAEVRDSQQQLLRVITAS